MSEKMLFADLKVIDMSSWIAAPVAATMLADFGAEVIKIEPPVAGDGYRNFALMDSTPTTDANYTWQMDNRNKRSRALNLKTEEGRELLRCGDCACVWVRGRWVGAGSPPASCRLLPAAPMGPPSTMLN